MATKVNIGGDPDDQFYRYKRDVLELRREHKHGVQTRLLNLFTIAKQLHVSVQPLASAIKKTLGVNFTVDKDSKQCIIQGAVGVEPLEQAIERYIKRHVLCRKCGLPELRDDICTACGGVGSVSTGTSSHHQAVPVQSVQDATQVASIKFSESFESVCHETLTSMLDWHDKYKSHPRYRDEWELGLDAVRAQCWCCEDARQANGQRKKWLKLRGQLDEEVSGSDLLTATGLGGSTTQ